MILLLCLVTKTSEVFFKHQLSNIISLETGNGGEKRGEKGGENAESA